MRCKLRIIGLHFSISVDDVPDGAVRRPTDLQEALAAISEEVAARMEGVPNAKLAEWSIEPAGVALATALRSDCAAVHTGLAIELTQLPHTVFKQRLTQAPLPHMLHEPHQ